MERFRPQRSPGSERFLRAFSLDEAKAAAAPTETTVGFELNEDELFAGGAEPEPVFRPANGPGIRIANRNSFSRRSSLLRPQEGILAALPDDNHRRLSPLHPANRPGYDSAVASTSAANSSVARAIPALPKPQQPDYGVLISVPNRGKVRHSAPVNVPFVDLRARRENLKGIAAFEDGDGNGDEDEMLPPHEIVARARAKESPMTTFSVLEGAGRTLKGRDLRQVRNAIWRKTGFLD